MKKLIVIAGPTASGKTALAIEIAQHFKTEIISADSRQCYRELHIGVAKPTEKELSLVKHHFINSHSIYDDVNAGVYERFALQTLDEIFKQHDVAICVGGTGMYLQALCKGLDTMPPIDKFISEEMNQHYAEKGLLWLQEEVKLHDPMFYQQGEMQNPARLLRALSFIKSSGISILTFRNNKAKPRNFEIHQFAIAIDRKVLYEQINQRVDYMMQCGLATEVKELLPNKHLPSLQTVGYTELFAHFTGENSLDFAVEKIKQHTRNYAKRQVTWFKNQGSYLQISAADILSNALKIR